MMQQRENVPTVGEIARRLDVPIHKVEYLIRAREIQPKGWAGNARVFSETDVDRIAGELQQFSADGREVARAR
jgi:DNA-binding transcriptional MerR regulator